MEAREVFLYARTQEGLHYELMQAPVVLGAQSYSQLCVAAKGEERRLAALRKRQQLHIERLLPRLANSLHGSSVVVMGQAETDGQQNRQIRSEKDVSCMGMWGI